MAAIFLMMAENNKERLNVTRNSENIQNNTTGDYQLWAYM